MSSSAPQEEKSAKEETSVPSNLLNSSELELMRKSRRESIEVFKKLYPNGKAREELESHNPASEESNVPYNRLTSSEKEYLDQKTKDATEIFKKLFPDGKMRAEREKEISTERVSAHISKYFASATEKNIKEDSSFNTNYESDKQVGNIYFERFLYGEHKKDTMVLKLIEEAGKWKVVSVTWRPLEN